MDPATINGALHQKTLIGSAFSSAIDLTSK
jgi:hypothetical protein